MIRVRLRSLGPSGKQILLTLVVALVLVPGATAYEVPSKLNEVAHVEAGPWRRLPAVPPRPCPVDLHLLRARRSE